VFIEIIFLAKFSLELLFPTLLHLILCGAPAPDVDPVTPNGKLVAERML